nr:hypothetical protein [Tanacetum cinerariifolium]
MTRGKIDWRKEPLDFVFARCGFKDNAIVQYPSNIPGEHVYLANTGTISKPRLQMEPQTDSSRFSRQPSTKLLAVRVHNWRKDTNKCTHITHYH